MLGYLGPEGSYSHICAKKIAEVFALSPLIPYKTISEIYKALEQKEINFGLLPVENSLGGSVPETLDNLLFAPQSLQVRLEWVLMIEHCLIGFDLNINEIRAHFQAFAQCDNYLNKYYANANKKEMSSNSSAALSLLNEKENKAAICSKEAAELYKIPIIAEKINDFTENFTRFWLAGWENLPPKNNNQNLISLAFRIPQDLPGGLVRVLGPIAERGINLSKIESRPTKSRLCEYSFYIDLINSSKADQELLKELQSLCSYFKFLGNYPVWPLNDLRFLGN